MAEVSPSRAHLVNSQRGPKGRERLSLEEAIAALILRHYRVHVETDAAYCLGVSVRTLQRNCISRGIKLKNVIDFVSCVRALLQANESSTLNIESLFPDLDPRTARERSRRVGLKPGMDVRTFLSTQRAIPPQLLTILRTRLPLSKASAPSS